jgi:hypothetical protein
MAGQVNREQAVHEARAKMLWGDTLPQVTSFLMIQGFPAPEASQVAKELFRERSATIRKNGLKKIVIGILLALLPVGTLLVMLAQGMLILQVLAITIMFGLYGLYQIIKGIFMTLSPKTEGGDVSAQ